MKKKYKCEVSIQALATKELGFVEFDDIAEYNEKAQELWDEQGNDYPTLNITNDFSLHDWDLAVIDKTDLKYCENK